MEEIMELARDIVEGTSDYAIDDSIMDYISEKYFDAEAQIEVVAEILEATDIDTVEDFETAFLNDLADGEGPILAILNNSGAGVVWE